MAPSLAPPVTQSWVENSFVVFLPIDCTSHWKMSYSSPNSAEGGGGEVLGCLGGGGGGLGREEQNVKNHLIGLHLSLNENSVAAVVIADSLGF